MTDTATGDINGYLVREIFSCPLKAVYLLDEGLNRREGDRFRPAVKLQLSRVLDHCHPGANVAARDVSLAAEQTREWMEKPETVISGGVVVRGRFRSRIPLMIRRGDDVVLYQVHGRLWRSGRRSLSGDLPQSGKLLVYLREAAYRRWMVNQVWPELSVSSKLCFPSRRFLAKRDHLLTCVVEDRIDPDQLNGLLTEVEATQAIGELMKSHESRSIHPFFHGIPFSAQMERLKAYLEKEVTASFQVTPACRDCAFRQSATVEGGGCWSRQKPETPEAEPHAYELIGQGNRHAVEAGHLLQKEVPLVGAVQSFGQLDQKSDSRFSIEDRRSVQLLASRHVSVPLEWYKPQLGETIQNLEYPIHFVDFEAASSPVPLFLNDRPYQEVLFQFSCHTLQKDGDLRHVHWLDQSRDGSTRRLFTESLLEVPELSYGTIVHYSPYEKQALRRLFGQLNEGMEQPSELALDLKQRFLGHGQQKQVQFLDLSRLVRDYYINRAMRGGLSLKEVLPSVLQVSDHLNTFCRNPVCAADLEMTLAGSGEDAVCNPYSRITNKGEGIGDGPSAMYAWLFARSGLAGGEEAERIYRSLSRYCAVDSLAMALIFLHWRDRASGWDDGEDLIVWSQGS